MPVWSPAGGRATPSCIASRTHESLRRIDSSRTSRARERTRKGNGFPMAEIKVATDQNFEELVLKSERPVVVDFWAAWCGPCKMVAPAMEKLAAKYDGSVDVVKVDVDANPGLQQAFHIMSIPTIAFFQPGKQPQGVVGFRPLDQLEQQFGLAQFAQVAAPTETKAAS